MHLGRLLYSRGHRMMNAGFFGFLALVASTLEAAAASALRPRGYKSGSPADPRPISPSVVVPDATTTMAASSSWAVKAVCLSLAILVAMEAVHCQTFHYSHGWTNGKRSGVSAFKENGRMLRMGRAGPQARSRVPGTCCPPECDM